MQRTCWILWLLCANRQTLASQNFASHSRGSIMIVYGSTCSSVRLSSSKTQFQLPGIHVVNHKLGHDMTRYRTFKISKHTLSMKCEMKLHIHTYYINEASNIYMYVCTYIYTYMYHVVCSTHICRYQIIHVTWYIYIYIYIHA